MFVPEDAKAKGHVVERRRGFGSEWFDFWNGDLYKHGFLFKEVNKSKYSYYLFFINLFRLKLILFLIQLMQLQKYMN